MKNHLLKAYEIIGDATPLWTDCGEICGGACCQTDDEGEGGVFLFPGEEDLLKDCPWGSVEYHGFAPMLVCDGPCDRDRRPLGCRIFPLTPVRGKNGRWTVRLDVRARPMCPLVNHGLSGLDPDFTHRVRDALRCIAQVDEGDAFLEKWLNLEEAYRKPLW